MHKPISQSCSSSTSSTINICPGLSYNSSLSIQNIRNKIKKQQARKKRQEIDGQSSSCEQRIPFYITLMWKEERVQREIVVGSIENVGGMGQEQMEKCVWKQLQAQGIEFKNGSKLLLVRKGKTQIHLNHPKHTQILNQDRPQIQGILLQPKISLRPGYSYLPSLFPGHVIKNLSISNKHGTVTWNTPLNITNINFDNCIKINRQSLQISQQEDCRELLTDVVVQFYRLPQKLEKYRERYGDGDVEEKLRKCVEGGKENASRLVRYVESNGHWFVHIILSKNMQKSMSPKQ